MTQKYERVRVPKACFNENIHLFESKKPHASSLNAKMAQMSRIPPTAVAFEISSAAMLCHLQSLSTSAPDFDLSSILGLLQESALTNEVRRFSLHSSSTTSIITKYQLNDLIDRSISLGQEYLDDKEGFSKWGELALALKAVSQAIYPITANTSDLD